jgi:hypothetical protein
LDYIIFGLGVGATLTLAGWSLREWGAAFRDRSSSPTETVLSGYELVNRMAWQRFCRSCGAVLAMFGLLVLVATIVSTALMLSDAAGSMIVVTTFVMCLVATLIWLGLFLHRFGARGILRPKAANPPIVAVDEQAVDAPAGPEAPDVLIGPPVPAVGMGKDPELDDRLKGPVRRRAASTGSQPSAEPLARDGVAHDGTGEEVAAAAQSPEPEQVEGSVQEPIPENVEVLDGVRPVEMASEADDSGPQAAEPAVVEDNTVDDAESKSAGDMAEGLASSADEQRAVAASPVMNSDENLQESQAPDAGGAAPDAASLSPDTAASPEVETRQASTAASDREAAADDEERSDADPSPASGRAEAVRSLRQRRIKRLMRDSSEPDS